MSKSDQKKYYILLLLTMGMGFFEMLGVASIGPFIAVLSDEDIQEKNKYISIIYDFMNPADHFTFVWLFALLLLGIITISNCFTAFATWKTTQFLYLQQHNISLRLLKRYLMQSYCFYLDRNTSDLTKNLILTVNYVVAGILMPITQALVRAVVAVMIIILLLIVDPILAIGVASLFGMIYLLIYKGVKIKLLKAGELTLEGDRKRNKIANECFGGIKDIKLRHLEEYFLDTFNKPSKVFAENSAIASVISSVPRQALEIIGFSIMILILLYLSKSYTMIESLPVISLYAFATYKLMPALQLIYNAISRVRFNLPALLLLDEDFSLPKMLTNKCNMAKKLILNKSINLKNLSFSYKTGPAILKNLNLTISAGKTVAFVGPSGSGKTTIVDLMLCLLEPDKGEIYIDDHNLTKDNKRQWQMSVGYVPQQIYLLDSSIKKNIAFGIPDEEIDIKAVKRSIKLAHLDDFINSLEDGYNTLVGERGVRISGGQKQRIGIARALYSDPSVLFFDEATNSLDNITESALIDEITEIAKSRTIIIVAHRLQTIINCSNIYVINNGKVIEEGNYTELIKSCELFRNLVKQGNAGVLT